MIELAAKQPKTGLKVNSLPRIAYAVSMPDPASHVLEIEAVLSGMERTPTVLAFPAWTPGSYKIRDFARNVSGFVAEDAQGELSVRRLDKQRFELPTPRTGELRVRYRLYANELSVRTPHMDDTHAFFLGTNALPYVEGKGGLPARMRHEVEIAPPEGWKVHCSLPAVEGRENTFATDDYDILGDAVFEIGAHRETSFEAWGKHHRIVIWGFGDYDLERIRRDSRRLVETMGSLFGGVPYDDYLFVHHFQPEAGGGLEHLNSSVCAWPSFGFRKPEEYERFIRLVSHEYFHAWNVKRIRPEILGPFDYSKEQHTAALWVMEGLTVYYERLWCVRAGIMPAESLLKSYAELNEAENRRPGRLVMSLEESSNLAWTKLYQADENFVNSAVSYYARGAQVCFVLDAKIRKATGGEKSLDDVLKLAFERYGWPKPGFAERGFEKLCEEVAQADFSGFWADCVYAAKEVDWTEALEVYGLKHAREVQGAPVSVEEAGVEPWLGLGTERKDGTFRIHHVFADGPAARAGLQAHDEILALNGYKVGDSDWEDRLRGLKPEARVRLAVFRRGRLVEAELVAGGRPAGQPRLVRAADPTPEQERNYRRWLWREPEARA